MIERGNEVFVIVPCMGRLHFLRQTAPLVLRNKGVSYCLVDYSCPDKCGEWLESLRDTPHRTVVERVPEKRFFNKCIANNLGAKRAIAEGAEYLCFLDADTIVSGQFVDWVRANATRGRFLIAGRTKQGRDARSLTGVLVVHARDFEEANGFDERIRGWGGEDIELRVRLALLHGLEYEEIPLELLSAIAHGDGLRTLHYVEKHPQRSNQRTLRRLNHRIWHAWKRRWKVHPDELERLWYRF